MTVGSAQSGGVPEKLPEVGKVDVKQLAKMHMGFIAKASPSAKDHGVRSTIGTQGAVERMSTGGQASSVTTKDKPPPQRGSSGLQERVDLDGGSSGATVKKLGSVTLVEEKEQVGVDSGPLGSSDSATLSAESSGKGSSGIVDSAPSAREQALKKAQDELGEAKFIMEQSKAGHDAFERLGGQTEFDKLDSEISRLEGRVGQLEGKISSQLRSIFPGGALKTARKELSQARSDFGQIQKYASSAEIYKAAATAIFNLNGRTMIDPSLSGGISTPKDHSEVTSMQKALVRNLTDLRASLIAQVPRTPVDMTAGVGAAKVECSDKQNNYVLHLDMHPNLTYDDETKKLTLTDGEDGVIYEVNLSQGFGRVVDGKIVIGEPLMCDQASFSDETFGGHVRMASFNDGNGWGNGSKGAAEKANEVALQKMEEGMRELVESDKEITSQDIIRVQDSAMMAAHDAVVSNETLGSTCPQLMTVAGNTAHLSLMGDTKCFVIGSDLSISDPTEGIRGGFDAKDPGGRIGGPKGAEEGFVKVDDSLSGADLRNYTHCTVDLKPNDTVIMCSDGVGDSLDPAMRGLTPEDCGLEGKEWDDENPQHNDYEPIQLKY